MSDSVVELLPRLGRQRPDGVLADFAYGLRVGQGDHAGQVRGEFHDFRGHAVAGVQLGDAPVTVVGQEGYRGVPSRRACGSFIDLSVELMPPPAIAFGIVAFLPEKVHLHPSTRGGATLASLLVFGPAAAYATYRLTTLVA